MTAPTVTITDLRHAFGGTEVLAIDRLVLPSGTTAILGPNGSGKTTLVRLLATVLEIQQGSVQVGALDLTQTPHRTEFRRQLGFAMQDERLPARMRVGEFCNYVAALNEIGPRRRRLRWTNYVLAEVGLSDSRGTRIQDLSGGMRRRVLLAQAMLGDPQVLLLDEPLVSLDAAHRAAIVRSIAASAQHRTTVVATHHADELATICRHVVVLVAGQAVFAGSPTELAAVAKGRTFETATTPTDPAARAMGPDRFRLVDDCPPDGVAVEPTVHDGYLAVVSDSLVR